MRQGMATQTMIDIVTGASQGIGKAIGASIAHRRRDLLANNPDTNYKLVLVGRNAQRGEKAAGEMSNSTGLDVIFEVCDLGNYTEVLALRGKFASSGKGKCRVEIIVNCAAEYPQRQILVARPRKTGKGTITTEQLDAQFASNVLGYHFMIRAFSDLLENSYIVNVASDWAGDLDLQDLSFKRRSYDNDSAYRQSKQCDRIRMLSKAWADRLVGKALVNACHPGDPCTTLSKILGYNMGAPSPTRNMVDNESPIPFLCGLTTPVVSVTGKWFVGSTTNGRSDPFADRIQESQKLFEICESYYVGSLSE